MSTVVCQNRISCFEQTEIASLKLKVAAPPTTADVVEENLETNCWNSLQNLSAKQDAQYIYPFERKSLFPKRSEKISLDLCTENLGSETGTDISDCSIFTNSYSSYQNEPQRQKQGSRSLNKVANSARNFPPPLTTISGGSNSLQVRPHREGGRLIIEAVETPFKPTYLQAERSDGRLRLSFLQDCDTATEFDPQTTHEEEEEENEECESEVEEEEEELIERDAIDGGKIENYEVKSESKEEDNNDNNDDAEFDVRIGQAVDVERGMEFQRLSSRCKEGGQENSWKPALWVAIS